MKNIVICLLGIVLIPLTLPVFAQDSEDIGLFRRGATYIRYHLSRDALPVWDIENIEELMEEDSNPTTLTFELAEINEIDAYFELAPDFNLDKGYKLLYASTETGEAVETQQVIRIQDLYDADFSETDNNDEAFYGPIDTSWNVGNVALALDYNRRYEGNINEKLLGDEHLIRGELRMPLGESGFSVGAYLTMYTANDKEMHEVFIERPGSQRAVQANIVETSEEVDGIDQAAFAWSSSDQNEAMSPSTKTPVLKMSSNRSAVVGAVNFSGAVKGVDVFTEVGFASGTGESRGYSTAIEDLDGASFYALGGAKYPLGQVTLGLEAGFENGDEPIDDLAGDFLGFEDNFWVDTIIEDGIPGDKLHDKLYAKVSASMSPTERMSVEGVFSCVKPIEDADGANTYGFEVNGAFSYSLASYVKYLIKAGVASLENASMEDSYYKVINKLEFDF